MNDPSPRAGGKPTRDEKAAYRWVTNMFDDPERYRPGLDRWLAGKPERAAIYDRVVRNENEVIRAARHGGLRRTFPRSPRAPRSRTRRWVLVGSTAAVIAVTGFVLLRPDNTGPQPAAIAPAESYATRVGEVRTVRLSDSSRVILDTDSLLRVSFTGAERDVTLLRGRARFNVTHNPARPFVVLAGGGSVTDVGTLFDVAIGQTVKVQLLRGTVDVRASRNRGEANAAPPLRLSPGEQTSFALATDGAPVPQAEAPTRVRPSDAQWVTGMKAFDDVPLSEIVAEANRYSDTRIEIADPEIASQQAFVELNIRDVPGVAGKLAELFHLEIDRSQAGLLVLHKPR